MNRIPFTRATRSATVLALAAGGFGVLSAANAVPAAALCAAPGPTSIAGDWHNINSDTRDITRIVVDTCASRTVDNGDGTSSTTFDGSSVIRMFGKCHPSDCDWGTKYLTSSSGWQRATYDFGFKKAYVRIKTVQISGHTYLRAIVFNDYTAADGRTDRTSSNLFSK